MDITMDNNKPSETQALISNANADMKHDIDETNNIFGVTGDHHKVNDKLNNIIDFNDMDNSMGAIENKEHAILSTVLEKTCLENDGDMGPETSVDTTDDVDNDTDPLEFSTLSHSKETLPSSEYQLDHRFGQHGLDLEDFHLQDKPPSLTSPNTDMPFDSQEMHEDQSINFEDMSHTGLVDQYNPFTAKHDDLQLGEDILKTDIETHEIIEKSMTGFEHNIDEMTGIDQVENIMSDINSDVIEKVESLNIGCETPEVPPNKDDLAYNEFEEFIEQAVEKMTGEELMQENFDERQEEHVECADEKPNDEEANKGLSTLLDTPLSISPASDNNFDSFIPHHETNDYTERIYRSEIFDEDSNEIRNQREAELENGPQGMERRNEILETVDTNKEFCDYDNDTDDFSEQEKHVHESPEYEKHSDLLEEQRKTIEEGEELASLKEELQTIEKHFEDMSEPENHSDVAVDDSEMVNQQQDFDNIKFEVKQGDEISEPDRFVGEFEPEQEKGVVESSEQVQSIYELSEKEPQIVESKEDFFDNVFVTKDMQVNESSEFEKHNVELPEHEKNEDGFNTITTGDLFTGASTVNEEELDNHADTFTETISNMETASEQIIENVHNLVEKTSNNENEILDAIEGIADIANKLETIEVVTLTQDPVEHSTCGLDAEVIENQTCESAIEPKPQHLDESHVEPLQMNEQVLEQPQTTTIDDITPAVELVEEEKSKMDEVASLEHKLHIEPSEQFGEVKGDQDINELISKQSELTIDPKPCDESLDEWNIAKQKVADEEQVELLANIEAGESVQNIESQHTEEFNKNVAEEEKTCDRSAVEESEEDKALKDISDNLDLEVDNMTSPLNPNAKEFVPSSSSPISFDLKATDSLPVAESLSEDDIQNMSNSSPFVTENEKGAVQETFEIEMASSPEKSELPKPFNSTIPPHIVTCMNGDDLVAQSPQKGATSMIDFQVPTPNEFASEVANRPSEVSTEAPENLNLKESLHEPEKELISPMDNESSLNVSSDMPSPIDTSLGKIEDIMNSVQVLPVDDDLEEENKSTTSIQPEVTALNGEIPLAVGLNSLKIEEPKAVVEAPAVESKVEKTTKTAEPKKVEAKSKASASTGPKKTVSSTSASVSSSAKAKTPATASKTASATATARPRTAPAPSLKPVCADKKSSTNVTSARAKPETKSSPVGLKKLPLTKPKTEDSNRTTARQTTSKVATTTRNTTTTARTSSSTNAPTTATAKRAPVSTTSTAAKTPTGPRPTLSPSSKTPSATSTHKPALSPRGTVSSTLRKTEALKSPTGATKTTVGKTSTTATATVKTTSRVSTGASTMTKTTTTTTKKLTSTTASKPATAATTAKKAVGVKKPLGTTTTTATKVKAASSPNKATAAGDTPEIKMNGTTAAEVTTNGNGISEE